MKLCHKMKIQRQARGQIARTHLLSELCSTCFPNIDCATVTLHEEVQVLPNAPPYSPARYGKSTSLWDHKSQLPCAERFPLFTFQNSEGTVGQNNQKYRQVLGHSLVRLLVRLHRSLVRLLQTARFAHALRCTHSFACSLDSLTPSLVGKWLIRLLFCLCFFLFSTIVQR